MSRYWNLHFFVTFNQNEHKASTYIVQYVIYLLEYSICKIEYVGKFETPFHIRLDNHRKDIKDVSAIPACKNFNLFNHVFNAHGKFTIIEQLRSIASSSTEILKQLLKQRENFWVKKLKTIAPYCLNQELNQIHNAQFFLTT